ncbi:hypothetical protein [Hugenholtzia roseola]|uniref:hypothetical protein n=1 Tax=Hugenholtzia roseola TaxID=1002 RepID=UPI00047BD30B|nr:hypothetical protein [Hugenholtzia roseola]
MPAPFFSFQNQTQKKPTFSQLPAFEKQAPFLTPSFRPNWVRIPENVIFKTQERLFEVQLSDQKLTLIDKSQELPQKRAFALSELQTLQWQFKRLLLPLILGSVLASLSFIALLKGLIMNHLGVILTLIFGIWAYYGWQGRYFLEVWKKGGERVSLAFPYLNKSKKAIEEVQKRLFHQLLFPNKR